MNPFDKIIGSEFDITPRRFDLRAVDIHRGHVQDLFRFCNSDIDIPYQRRKRTHGIQALINHKGCNHHHNAGKKRHGI